MMKTGLLWFDDDPKRPLEAKVRRAAERYQAKFGAEPNTCYVNPGSVAEKNARVDDLQILGAPFVLPNHFYVGVSKP
jgi:hypothetical protein